MAAASNLNDGDRTTTDRKRAFVKYLEETGAMAALVGSLEKLYEEGKEPLAAISYLKESIVPPPAILKVTGRQIFDSRGNPTVECDVTTHKGTFRAAVPSGASTGIYEAVELRDKDTAPDDYLGKGVLQAVSHVNGEIATLLVGKDPTDQKAIDDAMIALDGTENKGRLGANAILAASIAVCKAGAAESGVPLWRHIGKLANNDTFVLPVPAFNIINGGSHAGNRLAFQEYMILPTGASSFTEAMKMGSEVYHKLKGIIKAKYGQDSVNVGDEGGFAPSLENNEEGLKLIVEAIEVAGYTGKVKIGMDVAASEFLVPAAEGEDPPTYKYDLDFKAPEGAAKDEKLAAMPGDELRALYASFVQNYPVISIEDPFDQDDAENTTALTADDLCQIVGDDLLVTNPKRVQRAIDGKWCNALLLKVNQIGSVSEAIEAVGMSKNAGWGVMTSHRSGETEDSFIADLAVGLATGQIKTGAPCRSERLSKYNQLLRIEEEMGKEAVYAGESQYRHISWTPYGTNATKKTL